MVKHLLAALPGSFAGSVIGLLVQNGELGDGIVDAEQLLRRMIIGAATWALGAASLSFVFERTRGRQWAWGLGVAVVMAALCTSLAIAGSVVLGFAMPFAWLQASSLTAIPAFGVWLGGAIALGQRANQVT
jgi:hypothetical protein